MSLLLVEHLLGLSQLRLDVARVCVRSIQLLPKRLQLRLQCRTQSESLTLGQLIVSFFQLRLLCLESLLLLVL
jgi:hypothetical protein